MLDTELEKRFNGRHDHEKVCIATEIILSSPNGEYKRVFGYLQEKSPSAAIQLREKICPRTGLMQRDFFQRKVKYELEAREHERKRTDPRPGTYVFLATDEVEQAKEYFKTNDISPTRIIGSMDGLVGAFLPCDYKTALKTVNPYLKTCAIVECKPGMTAEELEKRGREDLKIKTGMQAKTLRLLIAESIHREDAGQMIERYFRLKDICERL